jgi:ketosteroid isomerase-like protein
VNPRFLPAVASILVLAACGREGPEARIRKAFEASRRAVEAGDAAEAAAVLSPKFAGPEGMDRAGARLFLAALLRRQKVGVTVVSQKVEVEGPLAVQTLDLLLTGREGSALLPDHSRKTLILRWELRDGAWSIREAQWD